METRSEKYNDAYQRERMRHNAEAIFDTGNGWKVICACGWEACDRPTWEAARTAHRRHRKKEADRAAA